MEVYYKKKIITILEAVILCAFYPSRTYPIVMLDIKYFEIFLLGELDVGKR
jgi:hypothetical protein